MDSYDETRGDLSTRDLRPGRRFATPPRSTSPIEAQLKNLRSARSQTRSRLWLYQPVDFRQPRGNLCDLRDRAPRDLLRHTSTTAPVVERLVTNRASRHEAGAPRGIGADEVHAGVGRQVARGIALVQAAAAACVVKTVLIGSAHQSFDRAITDVRGPVVNLRIVGIGASERCVR